MSACADGSCNRRRLCLDDRFARRA